MGLDIKKLREMQKDIKKKSGDNGDLFMYANKLGEETDVRILPPKPSMNGVYFVEQTKWWVNGKPVSVDGDNDVIEAEIEEARASKDKTVIALLDKKKNNMALVKKEITYLIPVLELKATYNDDEELESVDVVGAKVLVSKPTLLREINKIVTGRQFQNGTKDGIADRVKGHNIILTKEGTGIDTKYGAMGWNTPTEIEEKYYAEKEVPDVLAIVEKSLKSTEHQISVIRNYLYGDDIIEDEKPDTDNDSNEEEGTQKEEKSRVEKKADALKKDAVKTRATSSRPTTKAGKESEKATRTTTRSLIDDAAADMEDMDD